MRPEVGTVNCGEPGGIDLGGAVPIMLSTGWDLPIARTPGAREKRRGCNLHKQLSRQRRGSANRGKTIRRIRALAAGQGWQRLDAAHRATAHTVKHHSHVAMDGLRLLNMTNSAKGTAGGTFILVDPRNTSRRFNPWGHVSKDTRKNQAEFKCVSCGLEANAD